jgi:uncharacterized protein
MHWMDAIELVAAHPSMYLELSTADIVFAVRLAIAEIPERTLFGSDAPYGDPGTLVTGAVRARPSGAAGTGVRHRWW